MPQFGIMSAMKLKRFEGNPILSPNPANEWESLVTTNPGAWYDEAQKRVIMLYRAAGPDRTHIIRLGLATSTDGYRFERAGREPAFGPSVDAFDGGCVEDPRIVKFGEHYFVTYASRPFPPGQYWTADNAVSKPPPLPPEFPQAFRWNATATGLAITKDFKSWLRAGRLTSPMVDDRDVILFPEKVGGKFVMLHRPMNWGGEKYGTDAPAMWVSFSDDLLAWGDSRLLARSKYPWEGGKIGGNTPPIRTPHGWFTLYHAVGGDGLYRLGAFLLDLDDPSKVIHRTTDWLLQPEEPYELVGYYPGVVFPCGSVVIDGKLFVYYGGADKYVGVATCKFDELIDHLRRCPA
jgi:predicted GH43/DUF377 family glycosyl hydrolase